MLVRETFENWLKRFDKDLRIMVHATNQDIDVLYRGEERICSIPKGLKNSKEWTDKISNKRKGAGHKTSDGMEHRSLSGVGIMLLTKKIITPKQFVQHFTTDENKELLQKMNLKL